MDPEAVVDVARAALGAPLFEHRQPLEQALAAYDRAAPEPPDAIRRER